jgi:hypothetical protein
MQSKPEHAAQISPNGFLDLLIAVLCAFAFCNAAELARASDPQRSTDEAAIDAKKELCIALNRGQTATPLKEKFFEFYEGKRVVAQRLGPDTFRVGQVGLLSNVRVVQVQGPNKMLVSMGDGIFLLDNVATADVADGQNVSPQSWFYVRETETYETVAGGTKTVYVLTPCPNEKKPRVSPTRVYPWYDKKDEVVVTGEFKKLDGSKAIFSVNGQERAHALSKFTSGDRALLRLLGERYPPDPAQENRSEKPSPVLTLD